MASAPIAAVTDFGQFAKMRADAKANDPAALKKAAQQFESMFTEMLLKSADASKVGDDLTGAQGDFYKDLYNQQMATQLSSGKGLGLADMLIRQVSSIHRSVAPAAGPETTTASSSTTNTDDASQSQRDFVAAVRPHAEKAAAALGVPAQVLIAQAALETGWGKHVPKQSDGSSGFNLFGVKAGGSWSGAKLASRTSEFDAGSSASTGSGWTQQTASFRAYGSIGHSFDDYVCLLKNNPRYASAIRSGSAAGFAYGLQQAGYATDPDYAQKLLKISNSPEMRAALSSPSTVTV